MTPALIGRDHPAGVLRAEIGRATGSHGGLVLVTGEAGIGKTTLVMDAADEARRRGALVLGGSCWDSQSAPGYWPWVQVVRGLRRGADGDAWAEAEKAAGGRLAVLLGEATREATREATGEADTGGEGFPLYDAVTTALVTFSQRQPLVVVLDDLHWADPASLRLLEFAAQHAWFERLLLIGTYRDAEVEAPDHPLQQLILPLAARAATTVTLTGLQRDEVGALIELTAGVEPDPALVDEVHRRTGGNPFFVEQTARIWHSGAPVTAVAPGVREAVRRRLALLPEPVGELLVTAAVLGREFHRRVLAAVAGLPVPHVDRLLARAAAARLVTAGAGGRFAFVHDLVRETLYESLTEDEARARHADVIRALDGTPAPSGQPLSGQAPSRQPLGGQPLSEQAIPSDLARHAYLAGDELARERRVELLLAAAGDASSRLAGEEAVGHYRRALEAAEPDSRKAALICLDLGGQLRHSGDDSAAWLAFDRAEVIARLRGEPELLARVAITLHQHADVPGKRGQTRELLREAHRALIDGAREDPAALSDERIAQELAVRATALARSGEDDDALAFSLWARHDTIWGLGTSAERLTLTDEMAEVARRTDNRSMELHATSMRWVTLLEQGDPRYLEQLRTFVALAGKSRLRLFELALTVDQSLIHALHGAFDEAERLLAQILGMGHGHTAFAYITAHMEWALALLRGRLEEAEAVVGRLDDVGYPYPRLLEGITAAERGDGELAVRLADELQTRPEPLPRVFAPLLLRLRAQAAMASGDPQRIAEARDALLPYAGQWLVALYGCDISGPVDLWLGLLSAAAGRLKESAAHLTAAAESADRLRARPWSQRARAALARADATPADGAPVKAAPAGLTPADDSPAKAIAAGEVPAGGGLADGLAVKEAPTKAGPTGETLAKAIAAGEAPAGGTPADGHQANEAPASKAPAKGDPAKDAHAEAAPAKGATAHAARAEAAPANAAHAKAAPAEAGAGPPRPPHPAGEFRRDGSVWALTFAGQSVHVPDAKGLRDLHTLLSSPGRDVPAAELLDPAGGEAVAAAHRFGGDPVLDDEAKARYRRRLSLLDEEIDRAVERGDDARAAEFDRERSALLEELRTAAGLGGRTRRLGETSERARKAVTARIRDTLRRLAPLHPSLTAHLRESVTTGSRCSYRPRRPVDWRL